MSLLDDQPPELSLPLFCCFTGNIKVTVKQKGGKFYGIPMSHGDTLCNTLRSWAGIPA